jgi:branched-chain amino acid transport system substrate-binding protein
VKYPITLCVVLIFLLTGCGRNVSERGIRYNSPNSDEITIGVAFPASSNDGSTAYFARSIEFAVKKINESGGVLGRKFNVVVRDDGNNANTAMQIAQTFSDQGITAVVGHWSTNVSYYAEDIYEKNRVVMLTPWSTGMILFNEKFNYVFRMIGSTKIFAWTIASYMVENGHSNTAIFFSEDEFGIDLAKIIEKELNAKGVRVVDRVTSITPLNVDLILNRWNAFGCDSIIIASSYPDYIDPIKTIRGGGSSLPIIGDDTFEWLSYDDLPYEYFNEIYTTTLNWAEIDSVFLEDFFSEYGSYPDAAAVNGYEAVMLLKDAIEAVGSTDGTAIANYLSNLKDYKTISSVRSYNSETQEFDGYRLNVLPVKPETLEK